MTTQNQEKSTTAGGVLKAGLVFLFALAFAGGAWAEKETLLDIDFTDTSAETAAAFAAWEKGTFRAGRPVPVLSENGMTAYNWGQDYAFTSLAEGKEIDLNSDAVYTISYTIEAADNNFLTILMLTGANRSLALGNGYQNGTGLYLNTGSTDNILAGAKNGTKFCSFSAGNGVTRLAQEATLLNACFSGIPNNGWKTWTIEVRLVTSKWLDDTVSLVMTSGEDVLTSEVSAFSCSEVLSDVGFLFDCGSNTAARLRIKRVSVECEKATSAIVTLPEGSSDWTKTALAGRDWSNGLAAHVSVADSATLAVSGTGDDAVTAGRFELSGVGTLTLSGDPLTIVDGGVVATDNGSTLAADAELVFANGGAIAGGGTINPSAITVKSGELTAAKSLVDSATTFTVEEEATFDYGSAAGAKLVVSNLAGDGTIKYKNTGGHGGGVDLTGSSFTGVVDYVGKIGYVNLALANASRLEVSKLNAGDSMWKDPDVANSLDTDVLFKTDYQLGDTMQTTLTFGGNVGNLAGTTLTIGGNSPTINLNGGNNNLAGAVTMTAGTLNVGGDTTFNGAVSASGRTINQNKASLTFAGDVTLGAYRGGNDLSAGSELTVGTEATVNVEQNLTLRYEHNKTTLLNLNGTLKVGGVLDVARDGVAAVNFAAGGKLIASRIGLAQNWQGVNKSATIRLVPEATLIVGAGGVNNGSYQNANNEVLSFADGGVLGTSADSMTVAETVSVVLTGTQAVINTAKYSDDVFTETASEIVIDGVISGAGGFTKTGVGVLNLTGVNTYTGETAMQGGTLRVATAPAGDVSVAAGAVFDLCAAPNADGEYKLSGGAFTMADGASVCINGLPVTIGENGVFRMVTRNEDGVYLVPQGAVATFNGNSYYTIDEALAAVAAAEGSLADIEIVNAAVALPEGYALYTVTDGETCVQKLRVCGRVYGVASTALFTANTIVLTAEGYETKLLRGDTLCITNNATRLKLDHQAITALVIDLPNASDIVEIGNSDGYAIAGETVTIERGVFKLTIDGGDAKVKGGRIIIADDGGLDNHGWVDFVDEEVVLESIGDHTILTNSNGNQAHIRGTTKIVKRGSGTLTIAALFDVARPVEVAEGVLVLPTTTITTLSGSGKLSIPAGVTITAEGAITGQITGAGSIAIAAKDSLGSANLAADWTGSVVLPALTDPEYLKLNDYGTANSTVIVSGITIENGNSYLNYGNSPIIAPLIKLDGTLVVNNGSSNRELTFNKITGAGDINFKWTSPLPVTIEVLTNYTGTIAATSGMATTITKLVWTGDTAEKVKVLSVSSETGKDNVTVSSIVGADGTALDVTISKEEGADGYGIYIAPKAVATVDPTAGASTVEIAGEADATAESIAASVNLAEVVQIPEGAVDDYLNYLTKSAAYDSATGKWVVTIDLNPDAFEQPVITDEAGGLVAKLDDIMSTDEAVAVTVSNAIPGFYYSVETCDVLGSDVVWDEGARTLARGATVTLQVPARTRGTSGFFRICVNFANKVAP